MAAKSHQHALKLYQKHGGNFSTKATMPLKKESDLASWYYPGILGVLERIQQKPESQQKYCLHHKTFAVVSTQGPESYPMITAKAALLSHISGANVIPLLLRYEHLDNLPRLLDQLAINFQAILCSDFKTAEKRFLTTNLHERATPIFFHQQMEAAAVVAAIVSAAKMLKKSLKKTSITIEGTDEVMADVLPLLTDEGAEQITLIDSKGALYDRRPNMNKEKIELVGILKAKKDTRTREKILGETDIYLNSDHEGIRKSTTEHIPEKSVLISLRSETIEKKAKQAMISTLPHHPNHLTDLHVMSGIMSALSTGRKAHPKTLAQAIKGLTSIIKSPRPLQLFPGLLDKNLARKISAAIK
jgi:malate dehydrogenase (oxaloacetate-decarboxylating)